MMKMLETIVCFKQGAGAGGGAAGGRRLAPEAVRGIMRSAAGRGGGELKGRALNKAFEQATGKSMRIFRAEMQGGIMNATDGRVTQVPKWWLESQMRREISDKARGR